MQIILNEYLYLKLFKCHTTTSDMLFCFVFNFYHLLIFKEKTYMYKLNENEILQRSN